MNFLQNRKIAALVMVLMILASTLIGGNRSLMKMSKEAQEIFYNGEDGDGIGIQSDLDERMSLSYNLVTIGKKYLDENDSTIKALTEAKDKLFNSKTPAEKCAENVRLDEAAADLYSKLEQESLSEQDEKYRKQIYTDFSSRNDTISHNKYNQIAENFNKQLEIFPASVLSKLTSIEQLKLFR